MKKLMVFAVLCASMGVLQLQAQNISSATVIATGSTEARAEGDRWGEVINVKDFGAVPGDDASDQTAITAAIDFAKTRLPATVYFPKGTYEFTSLGNLAYNGLSIKGAGSRETILKYIGTDGLPVVSLDAFQLGPRFVQGCNYEGFTIDGNAKTGIGFNIQGMARSVWTDVWAKNLLLDYGRGKAFFFQGVMLSTFKNIGFSIDVNPGGAVPHDGLHLTYGSRAVPDSNPLTYENIGNSSGNTFISSFFEGPNVGIKIHAGDQNTFINGAAESCKTYGLTINVGSRYNTFIGTGFENHAPYDPDHPQLTAVADIADAGISTRYTNIYASKAVLLQTESRGVKIDGGFFQLINVHSGAKRNTIEDVTVNHWSSTSNPGGIIDSGNGTTKTNIFNATTNTFL